MRAPVEDPLELAADDRRYGNHALERSMLAPRSLERLHFEVFVVDRDDHPGVQLGERAQHWAEEPADKLIAAAAAAVAAGEAIGVVDHDDRLAAGGGDRLERAVDILQDFTGGSLEVDAGERRDDLGREIAARDPELRGEPGRKATLTSREGPDRKSTRLNSSHSQIS